MEKLANMMHKMPNGKMMKDSEMNEMHEGMENKKKKILEKVLEKTKK